ncbi:PAS domain S-box protein [uncultured Desulfobulbus sp.]|uniref:PAS domain S-box protein n=1 Tax=uncultured Desulfobulbus sp. TaxID=239745 RepID=UPI0029C6F528|nr:PAS domain S-box protein [uncultured Desulfobulbus sp.]
MPSRNRGQQDALRRMVSHPVMQQLDRLAAWPVAAAALTIFFLLLTKGRISHESPFLLMGLHFVFATLVSLFIAMKIGRNFLAECRPGLLLLGCGSLIWGLSGFVGVIAGMWPFGFGQFNANTLVTIHNTCAWVSAFCHLTGVAISFKPHEILHTPRTWLMAAYLGILALAAFITLAAVLNWMPPFFQPGQGGTLTRQLMLGSAITMFVLAALFLRLMHRQAPLPFVHWYSLAIFLFAAGLTGILFQKVNGSALGWAGRITQYLGGVYLLVAALRSPHGFQLAGFSLQQAAGDARSQLGVAVGIAVASTASAAAVRMLFLHDLGTSLSYVTFFPAVMLAAFMGGFGPGLLTTLLSTLLVFLFWSDPVGRLVVRNSTDLMEAFFFIGGGLLVALVARGMHRAQSRVILAEAEVGQASERLRAAEALRASEERLANVIEATEAGVWDWDIQSGEVVFNERWAEIAGYTLAELAPVSIQTWLDLAHPDDRRKSDEQLDAVFARVLPRYDIECRMKHRNGGWVWVHDRGKVIDWTEDGKPRRMTGSHTDITARKQAEEQLAELARELHILLETVPVGITKVVDRKQVWINRKMEELLGYSKEEMLFQSTRKFYPSEDAYEALGQAAYPLLARNEIYETEQRLLRKDGTPVLLKLVSKAFDHADLSKGSIWTMEDISERKQVEEAVQDRAELFHALFERNQAVKLLVDPSDGAVIDANSSAAAYYGYPLERLKALNISDINILSPEEVRIEMLSAANRQGSPFQFRHRLASGEIRDVEVYSSPIEIGGRSLLHSIVHDVTDRRRVEASLRENRALLRSITEGTSDAVYVKDWAGRYQMANTAMARSVGKSVQEIMGKDDRALYSPDDARRILESDRRILEAGEVRTYEEYLTTGGVTCTFLSTKGPVRNSQGVIVGFFGIDRDITQRKILEEVLRERENNLRNLVETTSDMIVVASIEGRVLFTNGHFERRLGYSRDDHAAMHLLDLHPPDLRREAEGIFAAMLRGERDTCPLPVMTRQGVVLPVETRAWAGKWGGQECIVGFIKDLSAEQEAQQRFERLFRRNPAPMALSTISDCALIDVNDAFLAKLGYAKVEVIGKTARKLGLFRPQVEKAEALLPAIYSQRCFSGIELQVAAKDGRILDGLFSGEVINSQGQDSLLTVMIDITERKQMEDTLRLRDATLTAIIENQPGLLWLKDSDGRFLAVNTPFARACSLDHCEDVVGKTDLEVWPAELASKYIADDKAVMQSGTSLVVEEPVWERGVMKWYETFKTPILNNQGSVIGTTGYSRDITERKRAEEEVRRAKDEAVAADEAKSKLLSTVAHEFRTPLSLLQSSLDILDRYGERLSKEQRKEQDKYIRSASRQLSILADTVLTYRTMATDTLRGAPEPCDILELSLAIANETRAAWSAGHGFKVNVDLECDVLLLDGLLFRRILENLLANAFQYTPPVGSVSLDVFRDNGWLRLTIADQGIGMEEKDREQAFESFHRGRNVGQRRGMGLGLSIVREALLQMGGTVTLTSAVGDGTAVEVAIPWREVRT